MPDRDQMLNDCLANTVLRESTNLTVEQLSEVSFSSKTSDPLIEALKKLIFSYCQKDPQSTVLRNVNAEIERVIGRRLI